MDQRLDALLYEQLKDQLNLLAAMGNARADADGGKRESIHNNELYRSWLQAKRSSRWRTKGTRTLRLGPCAYGVGGYSGRGSRRGRRWMERDCRARVRFDLGCSRTTHRVKRLKGMS